MSQRGASGAARPAHVKRALGHTSARTLTNASLLRLSTTPRCNSQIKDSSNPTTPSKVSMTAGASCHSIRLLLVCALGIAGALRAATLRASITAWTRTHTCMHTHMCTHACRHMHTCTSAYTHMCRYGKVIQCKNRSTTDFKEMLVQ